MSGDDAGRTVLVDASVFITLAEIDRLELLRSARGPLVMPATVVDELTDEPAATAVDAAAKTWLDVVRPLDHSDVPDEWDARLQKAATHLGRSDDPDDWAGDVPLLATAMERNTPVVVTDDKPIRRTCKALSIPVSGSIGVLIRAVERGDLDPEAAKDELVAMDAVGARLSASSLRRAERLIDDAAD
jgi:predicted nucleic acid-binding protein